MKGSFVITFVSLILIEIKTIVFKEKDNPKLTSLLEKLMLFNFNFHNTIHYECKI